MHRIIPAIVALVIFTSPVMSQDVSLFDKLLHTHEKDTLPYRLLKPVNPGALERYPLVMFFHGAGERGNDNEVQIKHITDFFLNERNRGKYPCYVVAPQCPRDQVWSSFSRNASGLALRPEPSKVMTVVLSLIDKLAAEFPIDTSRMYVIGVSMGGYAVWDLIARYPRRFAAAVPICGGGDPKTAPKIRNIPIWTFHGALDKVVSPEESRRMVRALQDAGGHPGYNEYPDVEHDSWVNAFKEPHLVHWLFRQQLGDDLRQ